ncbi:MAG: carboxypeptidase-like regulatory domain-containing protein [Niabella sp.]|nr:carboxypeptidase-like regulatory domain-containing protein [Niabella sp.]
MAGCCSCNSETNRDGSGQLSRYLKALDPSYAPIDDRSIEELLVFIKRYAKQIRFYDIPGSNPDNTADPSKISWEGFFRSDMAVIAASVALTDSVSVKEQYDGLRGALDAQPAAAQYQALFDPIRTLVIKIDEWYSLAIPENPLYHDLRLAINSNLKQQVQQLLAYAKGFSYADAQNPFEPDFSPVVNKDVWGLNEVVNADISIYQGTTTEDKIQNAALYIDDVFNNFYSFLKQLQQHATGYMEVALEQYPGHQPHMALFISFLQLFQLAQQQMNGITGRMLDFYYKDVLRLTTKPALPDKVHIVFELAKGVAAYDVAAGTALKAGKDALGKEQVYKTESDLVVNPAKVKEIKTVFIGKAPSISDPSKNTITGFFARPVANSKDGFGQAFTAADAKWPALGTDGAANSLFGNPCDYVTAKFNKNNADATQVGFALASPQLVLNGGNRLLEIQVSTRYKTDNLFAAAEQFETKYAGKAFFNVALSGAKGWINADKVLNDQDQVTLFQDGNTDVFNQNNTFARAAYYCNYEQKTITVFLPVAEQAVIGFDPAVHTGAGFQTPFPVVRILINQDAQLDENDYQAAMAAGISIRTKVGSINARNTAETDDSPPHMDGLKKLVLQNKDGVIEPGKPFDPFTAYPLPGRSFYIGSAEVFDKPFVLTNGDKLSVNIQKTMTAAASNSGTGTLRSVIINTQDTYSVSILQGRQWQQLAGSNFTIQGLSTNVLMGTDAFSFERTPIDTVEEWKPDTEKDFIKLDLVYDPLLADNGNTDIMQRSRNLAPRLEINEVSVSYDSTVVLQSGTDQFFHVYPFGAVETDIPGRGGSANALLVQSNGTLFPQFGYLNPYEKYYNPPAAKEMVHKEFADVFGTGNRWPVAVGASGNAVRLMLDAQDSINKRTNQYTGAMQQGMLYIGLEQLQPLQSISLLFQFAEGSAANEDDDPPAINWSYLSNNNWRPMKAEQIVSDGTYGFQTTGIIKIDIPADASLSNTLASGGLIWLCASVDGYAERIPQLIDIVTQAVEASFADAGNDPAHFDNALPAGSIAKLVTPVAEIGKVQQPFASFDGKHREVGKEFYTRVSERLRHKGRAVTAWDYEHLVLDRFPSVYKVKCITHTDPNCLCRTAVSVPVQKHFLLSYNSDDNFDNPSQILIKTIINDLATYPQLKATITIFDPGNNNSTSDDSIKGKIVALLTSNGAVDSGRITTFVAASGTLWTMQVMLGDYPSDSKKECCGPQVAPGHVLLVPIANLKNRNAVNPLQPKTSRRVLIAIQEFLKTKTAPFVQVHAKNPVYEQIIVSFKVQFLSGMDKGYYMKQLNEELVHFLTPWAFDETADVQFGQKIYASSIINFIEERSYVDFITDFAMGVCCNECCPAPGTIINGAAVLGALYDDENKQKPLEGIAVKIKELGLTALTDASGRYTFSGIPSGNYTLVIYFSLFNIVTQSFTIADPPAPVTLPDIIRGGPQAGYSQDAVSLFFSKLCSCNDIEQLLENDPNFKGDIVAKPCTARSILVSVPQHIIIPYEEGDEPSPCEKRKMAAVAGAKAVSALPSAAVVATDKVVAAPAVKAEAAVADKVAAPASKSAPAKNTAAVKAKKSNK